MAKPDHGVMTISIDRGGREVHVEAVVIPIVDNGEVVKLNGMPQCRVVEVKRFEMPITCGPEDVIIVGGYTLGEGILHSEGVGTDFERHTLNSCGRKLAQDENHVPELVRLLAEKARG